MPVSVTLPLALAVGLDVGVAIVGTVETSAVMVGLLELVGLTVTVTVTVAVDSAPALAVTVGLGVCAGAAVVGAAVGVFEGDSSGTMVVV